jgi:spoIIIJ-associated protein
MYGFEITSKDKDEALKQAIEQFNLPAEAIEVFEKGTGDEPLSGNEPLDKIFQVSVKEDYLINKAKAFMDGVMKALDISGSVRGTVSDEELQISVRSNDNRTLIGRKGEVLDALQHLLSRIITRSNQLKIDVRLDVGGYWEKRCEKILERVESAVQKVQRTNQKVSLFPMAPMERKLVHVAVKKFPGMKSFSVGKEGSRYVVIAADKGEELSD